MCWVLSAHQYFIINFFAIFFVCLLSKAADLEACVCMQTLHLSVGLGHREQLVELVFAALILQPFEERAQVFGFF